MTLLPVFLSLSCLLISSLFHSHVLSSPLPSSSSPAPYLNFTVPFPLSLPSTPSPDTANGIFLPSSIGILHLNFNTQTWPPLSYTGNVIFSQNPHGESAVSSCVFDGIHNMIYALSPSSVATYLLRLQIVGNLSSNTLSTKIISSYPYKRNPNSVGTFRNLILSPSSAYIYLLRDTYASVGLSVIERYYTSLDYPFTPNILYAVPSSLSFIAYLPNTDTLVSTLLSTLLEKNKQNNSIIVSGNVNDFVVFHPDDSEGIEIIPNACIQTGGVQWTAMTTDYYGDIYLSTNTSKVYNIFSSLSFSSNCRIMDILPPSPPSPPTGLTIDNVGSLWLTTSTITTIITRIDPIDPVVLSSKEGGMYHHTFPSTYNGPFVVYFAIAVPQNEDITSIVWTYNANIINGNGKNTKDNDADADDNYIVFYSSQYTSSLSSMTSNSYQYPSQSNYNLGVAVAVEGDDKPGSEEWMIEEGVKTIVIQAMAMASEEGEQTVQVSYEWGTGK